jgi:MFS family permease
MSPVVRMLVAGRAVNRLGAFSLPFLSLLLTQERGWSTGSAGLVMAAFGVATIPSRLAGGWMADRLGRRTTIVIGLVGCAVSQLGLAGLASDIAVVASVVGLGLSYEIYEPASQALITDAVHPDDRLRAHSAMAVALATAGAVAGGLAVVLSSVDLRWLFVADAVSCLSAAVFLGLALPTQQPIRATTRQGFAVSGCSSSSPWRDRRLITLLAVQTLFAIVYLQSTVALPLTVHARGLQPEVLGLVMVTSAITMVLAQPVLKTARVRGWTETTRLAVGFVVMAVGLAGYGTAEHVVPLVATTAVVSLGDLLLLGQLITLAGNLAPSTLRARYLAVFGTSWGFAAVAAPLVGTGLIGVVGVRLTWIVLAVVCAALGVASLSPRTGRALSGGGARLLSEPNAVPMASV